MVLPKGLFCSAAYKIQDSNIQGNAKKLQKVCGENEIKDIYFGVKMF